MFSDSSLSLAALALFRELLGNAEVDAALQKQVDLLFEGKEFAEFLAVCAILAKALCVHLGVHGIHITIDTENK